MSNQCQEQDLKQHPFELKSAFLQEAIPSSLTDQQKKKQYCSFFNIPYQQSTEKKHSIEKKSFKITQNFQQDIRIKIIDKSPKVQFVILSVHIGDIIIPKISIANFDYQSPIHKCENIKQGGFGRIYLCQSFGKKIAVKCIKKQRNQQIFAQNIADILKQYSYQFISTNILTFQVGPSLSNQFGYDIAVYSNCIEFAMEACVQLKNHNYDKQILVKDLRQNLFALHSFRIFHLDIKPENIMFSPTFNRIVFCDYGLSCIIRESFGYKTKTSFRGTLANCSAEMRQLYSEQYLQGQIDFYHNDLSCLKNAINLLQSSLSQTSGKQQNLYYDCKLLFDATDFHMISTLKYYIYRQKYIKIFQILKSYQFSLQNMISLFRFIDSLPQRHKIHQFLQRYFNQYFHHSILSQNCIKSDIKGQYQMHTYNDQAFLKSILYINRYQYDVYVLLHQNDHNKIVQLLPLYKKTDYLLLLSIIINLSRRQLDLTKLSEITKQAKNQLAISQSVGQFVEECVVQVAEVSLFLFKKSLSQKLSGSFLDIFVTITNNIAFLQLISYNQLEEAFKIILYITHSLQEKLIALKAYFSLYKILNFQSDDVIKWYYLSINILKIADQYLNSISHLQQEIQMSAIKTIIYTMTRKKAHLTKIYNFPNLGIDYQLIYHLSSFKNTIQPFASAIRELIYINQQRDQSIFEYYHFYLLLQQFRWEAVSQKTLQCFQRYSKVRLIKKRNNWKLLLDLRILNVKNSTYEEYTYFINYFLSLDNSIPYTFDFLSFQLLYSMNKPPFRNNLQTTLRRQQILAKLQKWNSYQLQIKINNLILNNLTKIVQIQFRCRYLYRSKSNNYQQSHHYTSVQLEKFKMLYRQGTQQLLLIRDLQEKITHFVLINIELAHVLIVSRKFQVALELLRKMFLLLKARRITTINSELIIILEQMKQRYNIQGERLIMVKDIYIYYTCASPQLNKSSIIETIITALCRFHPQYLSRFSKQIFIFLKAVKIQSLHTIIINSYIKLFSNMDENQYKSSFHLLYENLTVKQNPFHIFVLSMVFFFRGEGNFQQLYYDFYKASNGISFEMRSYILFYINYFYVCREMVKLPPRKLRYMIRLNILHGCFPQQSINIFNRLTHKNARFLLRLKGNHKKKKLLLSKIRMHHQLSSNLSNMFYYFIKHIQKQSI